MDCKIKSVKHWNRRIFSIVCSRTAGLRFTSGEFTTLSSQEGKRNITRPLSIASGNGDDYLEFLSSKIPEGELSGRLKSLGYNSELFVGTKPAGHLVLQAIIPGPMLWMISSGTGIAPFVSIINSSELWSLFSSIILIHSGHFKSDLILTNIIRSNTQHFLSIRKLLGTRFFCLQLMTKEPIRPRTLNPRAVSQSSSAPPFSFLSNHKDRIMVSGGVDLIEGMENYLLAIGFDPTLKRRDGQYAVERAFEE